MSEQRTPHKAASMLATLGVKVVLLTVGTVAIGQYLYDLRQGSDAGAKTPSHETHPADPTPLSFDKCNEEIVKLTQHLKVLKSAEVKNIGEEKKTIPETIKKSMEDAESALHKAGAGDETALIGIKYGLEDLQAASANNPQVTKDERNRITAELKSYNRKIENGESPSR